MEASHVWQLLRKNIVHYKDRPRLLIYGGGALIPGSSLGPLSFDACPEHQKWISLLYWGPVQGYLMPGECELLDKVKPIANEILFPGEVALVEIRYFMYILYVDILCYKLCTIYANFVSISP